MDIPVTLGMMPYAFRMPVPTNGNCGYSYTLYADCADPAMTAVNGLSSQIVGGHPKFSIQ